MRRIKTIVISCIMVIALAFLVGLSVFGPGANAQGNSSAEAAGGI